MNSDNPFNLDNINTGSVFNVISGIIREIETEYQGNQGLILTEDDLKSILYCKLRALFPDKIATMDPGIYASPLHTEVSFFDKHQILKHRPDIVILQPSLLSILHSVEYDLSPIQNNPNIKKINYKDCRGKEFEFSGNSIIFELKFCKSRYGINKRQIDSYKKDIAKITELQELAINKGFQVAGCVVIFNKTDKKSDMFKELYSLHNDSLKIFYGTGNVIFPKNQFVYTNE